MLIVGRYVPSGSNEMDPSGLKQLLEDCYDINNAHDDDHHKHKHKRPSGSSLLVGRWERVWESMNRDLRRGVSYRCVCVLRIRRKESSFESLKRRPLMLLSSCQTSVRSISCTLFELPS